VSRFFCRRPTDTAYRVVSNATSYPAGSRWLFSPRGKDRQRGLKIDKPERRGAAKDHELGRGCVLKTQLLAKLISLGASRAFDSSRPHCPPLTRFQGQTCCSVLQSRRVSSCDSQTPFAGFPISVFMHWSPGLSTASGPDAITIPWHGGSIRASMSLRANWHGEGAVSVATQLMAAEQHRHELRTTFLEALRRSRGARLPGCCESLRGFIEVGCIESDCVRGAELSVGWLIGGLRERCQSLHIMEQRSIPWPRASLRDRVECQEELAEPSQFCFGSRI
jgi:hypothetical protein